MLTAMFEELLRQRIGLDVQSIGPSGVARAVQQRQSACQLTSIGAYWEHLSRSASELQALIEAVVVPETWFFRDREAFATMARAVERLPAQEAALRVLSL